MLQAGRWEVRIPMMSLHFFNLLITFRCIVVLGMTLSLTKMSTRNLTGLKGGRRVRLTTLTPSVSRLPRQCGILDILQRYRPPRPTTGLALLLTFYHLSSIRYTPFSSHSFWYGRPHSNIGESQIERLLTTHLSPPAFINVISVHDSSLLNSYVKYDSHLPLCNVISGLLQEVINCIFWNGTIFHVVRLHTDFTVSLHNI
jgi:hypothetical protein